MCHSVFTRQCQGQYCGDLIGNAKNSVTPSPMELFSLYQANYNKMESSFMESSNTSNGLLSLLKRSETMEAKITKLSVVSVPGAI